jgi:tetratricopeptide (TPR) repeat protein
MRKFLLISALILIILALVFYIGCKKEEKKQEGETKTTTTATETETVKTATVSSGPLNMRSQPSTDGKVVTVLHAGDTLEILEESPNKETIKGISAYWYRVRNAEGDEGWVFGGYLDFGAASSKTAPAAEIGTGSLPKVDTSQVPGDLTCEQCYSQGKTYCENKNYTSAIAYLTRACMLKSDYGAAYFELGLAYQEFGDNYKAVQTYEKAVNLLPDDFWAHNNLGLAYINTGEYGKAVTVLQKALTLTPAGAKSEQEKDKAYAIARRNLEAAQKML